MTSLRDTILCGLLITLFACWGDSGSSSADNTDQIGEKGDDSDDSDDDDSDDDGSDSAKPTSKDAGRSSSGSKDGGASKTDAGGSGGSASEPGASKSDAGTSSNVNAGKDAGNGFVSVPDAGRTNSPASDTGTEPGTPDPNGPCADLYLFCFDIFDMFIFNPSDCFTCNGGQGCQGCAIPFAY